MNANRILNRHPGIKTLMALLLAIIIIPFGSPAMKAKAEGLTANLTVTWKDTGLKLALYQVAVRNDTGEFIRTDDFKDYEVDIENIDDNTAEILAAYATRDKVKPLEEITTDESGTYTFPNLPLGAYLLFDEGTVSGSEVTAVPVFVFLQKDLQVEIKPEKTEESTSCKVYKVWDDDDDDSGDRPESIKVQLLQNGEVYKEGTLSEDNNWTYSWSDLPLATYKIVEKSVPSGYKLSVSRSGTTWKLTNKIKPPKDDDDDDDDDDDRSSDDDDDDDNDSSSRKKIPQTGQLWWPVPLLLSAGFLCMIIGLLRKKKSGKK